MLLVLGLVAAVGSLLGLVVAAVPPGAPSVPLERLDPTRPASGSALSGMAGRSVAVVDRVLAGGQRQRSIALSLAQAGLAMTAGDFVVLVVMAVLAAVAVGFLLGGPLVALALGLATPLLAKLLLGFRAGRRRSRFADQLDDSLQLMASSLRAGHSLLRAMDAVSKEAPAPTSEEFSRVVNETRVGRDLSPSLDDVAARMGSDDFTWVAQAIAIHREVGGNLAEVLDAVGHTIRERNQIRRQVKALAAEGKLSAIVLMALPLGITAFLYTTNRPYIMRFTEGPLGWALAGTAVVMLIAGALWLRSTVRIVF